ncbi:hypothetical protein [Nocardioides pocheonensis]|uniref:RNA polymerase sigma factor 70 region 4 type 2 domain-containing protein n=1 Tax=Nocardioides pocheonensis TaxID=661485 RepID=A0A3N0GJQ7_9ACTN|nr:hypothetical protein [Nocardioides pocheonensis]RNM12679.1 hypothetical protein EFL26_18940 [Nocardioides pocheonensis]
MTGHADESFAEYVSARWSLLQRLATLLTGQGDADALTRAALVRAYLSWADVRRSASPDQRVVGVLAATAARWPHRWSDEEDASAAGPDPLWSQFGTLLPRQRALLVLRHHEDFSDPEIGEVLGRPTEAVAAEALALETGIDVARLRELFVLRSDAVRVAAPPGDEVLAEAQRERSRRRRRSWLRASAAAAVLVVALTVASLLQGPSDTAARRPPAARAVHFLSALPAGRAPRIAYAVGRSLHLGSGQRVTLEAPPSSLVQTNKWLYVAYPSGRIVRVDAVRGTVLPVARSSRGELATDPSGEHVAWIAAGPGPAVVVLRTAADWSVLLSDRQRFPAQPRCCDDPFVLNGITSDGAVIGSLPVVSEAWVWRTPDAGSDTLQEISGLGDGAITQVVGGGLVVRHPPGTFAVGSVVDGTFRPTAVLSARDADFADPLGHRVVYADDSGEIHVRERVQRGRSRRPSPDVRLQLPTLDQGFAAVRWEDDDHLLLDVADASQPHGALVRCDVGTGACELTARLDRPHLLAD